MIRDAIMDKIQLINTACFTKKNNRETTKKRKMKQANESDR